MTTSKLFVAFGNIDDDYLLTTLKSIQPQKRTIPRPRLRYAIIAATLALLVALIPIAVILANHTPTPPPPVTTPLPNPPAPSTHLSITDIPGAVVADLNDLPLDYEGMGSIDNCMPAGRAESHQWIKTIQEQYASAHVTLQESEFVIVEDGNNFYYIAKLLFKIEQPYYNTNEKDTVSLVYVHTYEKTGIMPDERVLYKNITSYTPLEGHSSSHNMAHFAAKNAKDFPEGGLCVFESSENHTLTINGEVYDLSQYADYYLVAYLVYASERPDKNIYGLGRLGQFYRECFENNHVRCIYALEEE